MLRLDKLSKDQLLERKEELESLVVEARARFEFEEAQSLREEIYKINMELASRSNPITGIPVKEKGAKRSTVCVCGKTIKAKGLCSAHHQTYLRTGKVPVLVDSKIELQKLEPVPTKPLRLEGYFV